MFCVWLRIGYSCFRWVQGIPPVMYPTAWILFVVGGVKERLWGGKEKFVFGSLLLWGWIVDILIRFGLCWDSFGSSVDAQCYKGFWNGDRYFDFVVHWVLFCVGLSMASIFPKKNVFEMKNSGWGLGLMCLFLSVADFCVPMGDEGCAPI
jgi:hypothetical protein